MPADTVTGKGNFPGNFPGSPPRRIIRSFPKIERSLAFGRGLRHRKKSLDQPASLRRLIPNEAILRGTP